MREVLPIERSSYEYPWGSREFGLAIKSNWGMVAEVDGAVVGYLIWERHESRMQLLNLAVAFEHRRRGIGRALVERLATLAFGASVPRMAIEVRESQDGAHLFLKAAGFVALNVLRGYYRDSTEDAYVFSRKIDSP